MAAKKLTSKEKEQLLNTLRNRFEKNRARHKDIEWDAVQARLEADASACWSLQQMELTGGEPDVVQRDADTGVITFMDCSPESPAGRRSLCYDPEAL